MSEDLVVIINPFDYATAQVVLGTDQPIGIEQLWESEARKSVMSKAERAEVTTKAHSLIRAGLGPVPAGSSVFISEHVSSDTNG